MIRKYFRLKHFAEWVTNYVFSDMCEDDLFAELACRKLKGLGLVEVVKCNGPVYEEFYVPKNKVRIRIPKKYCYTEPMYDLSYLLQYRVKELFQPIGEIVCDLLMGMLNGIKYLLKNIWR